MRLATFNLAHGGGLEVLGTGEGHHRLAAACRALDADVLCLQEVDRWQDRSGGVDQAAEVAAAMGAVAWRFEPTLVGEPGGRWRAAGTDDQPGVALGAPAGERTAAYGVAVISRLPVTDWHVVRLAAANVRSPVAVPAMATGSGRWGVLLLADEPRVALAAEVEWPGGRLLVATTHLSFVPGWNLVQLRRATRALVAIAGGSSRSGHAGRALRSGHAGRVLRSGHAGRALRSGHAGRALRSGHAGRACLLLGDLNLPGALPRWATGWRALAVTPTFPADRPSMQLDHVLGHGPLPEVTGMGSRRLPLSDHRAVTVDLAMPGADAGGGRRE